MKKENKDKQQRLIIQDGVSCPEQSPWPRKNMKWATMSFLPVGILGSYVLSRTDNIKFAIWIIIYVIFVYPLRYLVSALCPYYGQNSSNYFGIIVPRLFKKQEGKSMKTGLWLDVVFMSIMFVLPIPEMLRFGGYILLLVWIGSFLLLFFALGRMACRYCPLTFCPIGRATRAVSGVLKLDNQD